MVQSALFYRFQLCVGLLAQSLFLLARGASLRLEPVDIWTGTIGEGSFATIGLSLLGSSNEAKIPIAPFQPFLLRKISDDVGDVTYCQQIPSDTLKVQNFDLIVVMEVKGDFMPDQDFLTSIIPMLPDNPGIIQEIFGAYRPTLNFWAARVVESHERLQLDLVTATANCWNEVGLSVSDRAEGTIQVESSTGRAYLYLTDDGLLWVSGQDARVIKLYHGEGRSRRAVEVPLEPNIDGAGGEGGSAFFIEGERLSRGDSVLVLLPRRGFSGLSAYEWGNTLDYYGDQNQGMLLESLEAFEDYGIFAIQIPIICCELTVDPSHLTAYTSELDLVVADGRATSRHYLANRDVCILNGSTQATTLLSGFSLHAVEIAHRVLRSTEGDTMDVCMNDLVLLIPLSLLHRKGFSLNEIILHSPDISAALREYREISVFKVVAKPYTD